MEENNNLVEEKEEEMSKVEVEMIEFGISRLGDVSNIDLFRNSGDFNWEKRYNLEYILSFAREKNLNASRVKKAVENLDYSERVKLYDPKTKKETRI